MTFSKSSLDVFAELLGGYSLPANHPDFDRVAVAIGLAKRELAAALVEPASVSAPEQEVTAE